VLHLLVQQHRCHPPEPELSNHGNDRPSTQQRIKEFGLLVLCHTLSPEDQQEAIRVCRDAKARIRTVVLTANAPEFRLGPGSGFLSPSEGPETLIA
jgi:hypothetical protein